MVSNQLHYFLTANSSHGYVSFIESALEAFPHMKRTIGYPAGFFEELFEKLQSENEKEYHIDVIHEPFDNRISGFLIPGTGSALLNTPLFQSQKEHVFHLFSSPLLEKIQSHIKASQGYLRDALAVHDNWEHVYISHTDFEKLDHAAEYLAQKLLDKRPDVSGGRTVNRFFGAGTYTGAADYIQNITERLDTRYFIKGRPGTGKSTFLKKIAAAAEKKGLSTERYHCSFDPDSLDLVIIRSLSVCLFDSTAPHEYAPERDGDILLDLYEEAVDPKTDTQYASQLQSFAAQYKQIVSKSTAELASLKQCYDKLDEEISKQIIPEKKEQMLAALSQFLLRSAI